MRHILLSCRPEFAALLLILAAVTLTGCMRRYVSIEQLDKMIQEQVPVGSDKQQVKAFIDNLKVDSREILRDKGFHQVPSMGLGSEDAEKVAELGDRIAEYTGVVILKAESDGILTFNNIAIRFYIDKDGRMIGYTVQMHGAV